MTFCSRATPQQFRLLWGAWGVCTQWRRGVHVGRDRAIKSELAVCVCGRGGFVGVDVVLGRKGAEEGRTGGGGAFQSFLIPFAFVRVQSILLPGPGMACGMSLRASHRVCYVVQQGRGRAEEARLSQVPGTREAWRLCQS